MENTYTISSDSDYKYHTYKGNLTGAKRKATSLYSGDCYVCQAEQFSDTKLIVGGECLSNKHNGKWYDILKGYKSS